MISMNISERRVFATGIQASQAYTTYEREISGTLYRFVSHEDMYSGERLGISVSRMTGQHTAVKIHTFGRPVTRWGSAEPQSGYTPCACRDCMDVTVSSDVSKPGLCAECKEAGCTNHGHLPGFIAGYGLGYECQRDDAYGEA